MKLPQFDHYKLWGLGPLTDGTLTITPTEKEYHLQPSTPKGCNMSIFPYNKSGFEFIPVNYPTSVLDLFKVFFLNGLYHGKSPLLHHHFVGDYFLEPCFFFPGSILESPHSQALLGETFSSSFVAHPWVHWGPNSSCPDGLCRLGSIHAKQNTADSISEQQNWCMKGLTHAYKR